MYKLRIKRVQNGLKRQGILSIFITSSKNIFYLTGIEFSEIEKEGYLLLTQKEVYLFTDKRYTEEVRKPFLKLIEITREKPFLGSIKDILAKKKIKVIHFEKNDFRYSEFERFKKILKPAIITPSIGIIEALRIIKDEEEIRLLKKACKLTDKTFYYILKKIKAGVSEKELAFEMEIFIRNNGGQIAFPTIVAFGKNSAIPHHITNNTKLKKNSFILLDFGVGIEGYKSDMTRTLFFGKVDEKTKKIYDTVLSSQQKAIESLKKATTTNIPAQLVDDEFKREGFDPLIHGLGHGIGLAIHESPSVSRFSKTNIAPGMVFTIEPGIYINDFGGVRIEDDILIKKNGIETLTKSKKDLIELKI